MKKKPVRKIAEQIEKSSSAKKETERVEFIDTGSTLLNLAASQKGIDGGWARGRIINIVGDYSSGKTLLSLEACANTYYNLNKHESLIFPKPEKIIIVYNNVEGVLDFPVEQMYGKEFVDSVIWIQTPIAEDFGKDYQKRVRALKKGEFLLYVIDSIDALVAEAGADRIEKILSDKTPDGSYGTEKAKFFSANFFSHLCGIMKNKDATLICVSQVREKIGIQFGEKHYRTGGKALDFYTHQVCWLSQIGKLERTFRGQKKAFGARIRAKFKRNKTAKPWREAEFNILFDYGIDDLGSMLDYFYGPKAKEYNWDDEIYDRNGIVNFFEENEDQLLAFKKHVINDWQEIEEEIKVKRKDRWR